MSEAGHDLECGDSSSLWIRGAAAFDGRASSYRKNGATSGAQVLAESTPKACQLVAGGFGRRPTPPVTARSPGCTPTECQRRGETGCATSCCDPFGVGVTTTLESGGCPGLPGAPPATSWHAF